MPGDHAILVLDNAGWHVAGALKMKFVNGFWKKENCTAVDPGVSPTPEAAPVAVVKIRPPMFEDVVWPVPVPLTQRRVLAPLTWA